MKLGTENRGVTIVAIALMGLAAFMLVRMLTSGGQPAAAATPAAAIQAPAAPAPLPERGRSPGQARSARGQAPADNPLDPRLRLDLLKLSEDTQYKGNGRNIFRAEAEIPKPIAPVVNNQPPPPPQPQGPPPPPPINLKFVGFASGSGEPTKVFLSHGDDIFVASQGEIVNRRYKVVRINPTSVEIEDLLSNNRQTIPLTAG